MNIFTDTLFLFTFILAMLYFDLPNITDGNPILHKFYLFVSICGFFFLMQLIKKIKNKCEIEPYEIFQQSFATGITCILGYSFYNDLILTKSYRMYFYSDDKLAKIFIVGLTIVGFYLLVTLTMSMFQIDRNICT